MRACNKRQEGAFINLLIKVVEMVSYTSSLCFTDVKTSEVNGMEELTLEELIRYTVLIQQDSFLFYRRAARILEGSELKPFTDELADFKARQLKQLKELLSECMLNEEESDYMIDVETDLFDEILDNGEIPAQSTPRDVLFRSLNRENRIAKTYGMILNLPLSEEKAHEVFTLLLDDEIKHIDALRKRVESVRAR